MVYASFFRHVQRIANSDGVGGLSSRTSQSEEWCPVDSVESEKDTDGDRHTATGRSRGAAYTEHRSPAEFA